MFAIEMYQDFCKTPYYQRHLKKTIPFDPKTQYAVIKISVCTGEKVAGFRNMAYGHFTEVMLVRNKEDEKRFLKIYNLEKVNMEY
ncbi:MAG: aspartate dehydrogenase [Ruminococcus sp.]